MWWKIQQFYVASVVVFAILAVQNVQSQNLAECSAYLDDTDDTTPPLVDVVKVKNGTRLNFVYKGNINNCSNDSYVGWRAGNHIITYMNTNKVSNNYKFNVDTQQGLDDVCIYKFNMRVTFDDVPRGNIIFLNKQPHSECSNTYKICCRNVTAHYIMVIVEDDIIEPTTLPTPVPTPTQLPCTDCYSNCYSTPNNYSVAIQELQSNISNQIASECEKLDLALPGALFGMELLQLLIAFIAGAFIISVYCKLQGIRICYNKPVLQFTNPTSEEGAMDINLRDIQSSTSPTDNTNQD